MVPFVIGFLSWWEFLGQLRSFSAFAHGARWGQTLPFRTLGHQGPHGRHDREKSITQRSFVSLSGNVKYM